MSGAMGEGSSLARVFEKLGEERAMTKNNI
jgi:hypothetical protein